MINVTAGKLPEYCEALSKIISASDIKENNIPFELSYWAVRMFKKLKNEEEIFLKERDKLLEKHGEKILDDKGLFTGQFKFNSPDKIKTFNDLMTKLGDTDIVVEGISSKDINNFGKEFKSIFQPLTVLMDTLITDSENIVADNSNGKTKELKEAE